jgi:broad specificity phosphatase PhoE
VPVQGQIIIMQMVAMETTENSERPVRRRLYLMRHGDVSYFDEQGRPFHPETVPLNNEGRAQAEAARAALAEVPLDRVISSDLLRSVETAEIVVRGRGLVPEQRAELREIQPGRLRDIPEDALQQTFVGAFAGGLDRETRFLAGETFGSLIDRVQAYMATLLADMSWRNLLIVAHGGVNRTILARAFGLGIEGFAVCEQDPACINILDIDDAGQWLIRLVNYTAYNPAKIGLHLTTMERLYEQYRRRGLGQ